MVRRRFAASSGSVTRYPREGMLDDDEYVVSRKDYWEEWKGVERECRDEVCSFVCADISTL